MAKQYRARDRTVQKMGRDGLEEVNLHTQESRRISKKVIENGRLSKKAGDEDVLLNGKLQTRKRGRSRKRGHRRENHSIDGGGRDTYQEPPPLREYSSRIREFADSDVGHRNYGRVKSYAYEKQQGRAGEKKSTYGVKDKSEKVLSGIFEKRTASRKRLQKEKQKKDKLKQAGGFVMATAGAGNSLADGETEYSEQLQTDDTVQEMYGRLAHAGRNLSYRLYHGRERIRPHFSSKLRSDEAVADLQKAEGALNRRDANPSDVSNVLRGRRERSTLSNVRNKANPMWAEADAWGRQGLGLRNVRNREAPIHADMTARKQKNRRVQTAIQKRKYQKAYVEAVRNGVPATSFAERLKSVAGLQDNIFSQVNRKRHQGMLVIGTAKSKATVAVTIILTCVVLLLSVLSFAGIIFDSGLMAVAATTYQSTDEEIHSVEDAYLALESALDRQINGMESTHPGYDEYRYQVDEIAHNPFQLISYLTVAYGEFTLADVEDALRELFDGQYTLLVWEEVETRTRTVTDPDAGEETEEEYDYYILNISLTNRGFDTVVRECMTEDQTKLYEVYNSAFGNRQYLFDETTIPDSGATGGGAEYEIPPEALSDERFARMIHEAEKYLGYPYVWGGSSPSTSFDCSGFVSWVINNSGNGWSVGRQTANGLRGLCAYVSPDDAKPGDLIFFQGTYNTSGASHVGIVVGNGVMIHRGDPIQYANYANSAYWQSHLLSFGRLP